MKFQTRTGSFCYCIAAWKRYFACPVARQLTESKDLRVVIEGERQGDIVKSCGLEVGWGADGEAMMG